MDAQLVCNLLHAFLDPVTLARLCCVSASFSRKLSTSVNVWRSVYLRCFPLCEESELCVRDAGDWKYLALMRYSLEQANQESEGWRREAADVLLDDSVIEMEALDQVSSLCRAARLRSSAITGQGDLFELLSKAGVQAYTAACRYDDGGAGGISGICSISLNSSVVAFFPQSACPLVFSLEMGVSGYNDDPQLYEESALYLGMDPANYRHSGFVTPWAHSLSGVPFRSQFVLMDEDRPSLETKKKKKKKKKKRRKKHLLPPVDTIKTTGVSIEDPFYSILDLAGESTLGDIRERREKILGMISWATREKVRAYTNMSLVEVLLRLLETVRQLHDLSWFCQEALEQL